MQDIVRFMSAFSQTPSINQQLRENATATQTEIIAVHTPQVFCLISGLNSFLTFLI